jgi:hypothetical protein
VTEHIPMPPERYTRDDRVGEISPDRCPNGHRLVGGKVLVGSGLGPRTYTCLQCEPKVTFRPTPDLYDDLSWWYEPLQVEKRAYWRARPFGS